jgi:YD repeat-containing protein
MSKTITSLSIALLLIFLSLSISSSVQGQGTTRYVYDDNGRLQAVVAPTGDTAIYEYDAAGNLLRIVRQAGLSVFGVTPNRAPVGAQVTVSGVGFSATSGANTVKFNGVTASVLSQSSAELVVVVPVGATNGTVSVTTATATATSPRPFTIADVPIVTTVFPLFGFVGTSVAISGSKFDPDILRNTVSFGGTAAQVSSGTTTNLQTTIPLGARSGKVTVTTAEGTGESPEDFLMISGSYNIISTGTIADGETKQVNFPTNSSSFNAGILKFTNTLEGQKIRVKVSDFGYKILVVDPKGRVLEEVFKEGFFTTIYDTKVVTLPLTGLHYLLLVPGSNGFSGNAGVTLQAIPPDTTGTLTLNGAPVSVGLVLDQYGFYSFNATAGQKMNLEVTDIIGDYDLRLFSPSGQFLTPFSSFNSNPAKAFTFTTSETGAYKLQVFPHSPTLTLKLQLKDPQPLNYIFANGDGIVLSSGVPPQTMRLLYTGVAGQRLTLASYFQQAQQGNATAQLSIYKPDGTLLIPATPIFPQAFVYRELPPLPANGRYIFEYIPPVSGSYTVQTQLYELIDPVAPITVDALPVTQVTTIAGQNLRYTFSGITGQRLLAVQTGGTISNPPLTWIKPDGSILASESGSAGVQTLPVSGTYTLLFDPVGNIVGDLSVRLTAVQPDTVNTISIDGAAVTSNNTVAGQDTLLTFSGNAGQKINLRFEVIGTTLPHIMKVLAPDGSILSVDQFSLPSILREQLTLPVTGTYTVLIDYYLDTLGIVRTQLFTSPPEVVGVITIDAPPQIFTTTVPGQTVRLTFTGVATQSLKLQINSSSVTDFILSVFSPDGSPLLPSNFLSNTTEIFLPTLPTNGTYTVIIDPDQFQVGDMAIALTALTSTAGGTITIGGPDVDVSTQTGGEIKDLTFSGLAGQSLALKVQPFFLSAPIASPVEIGARSNRTTTRSGDSRATTRTQNTQRGTTARVTTEAAGGGPLSGINVRVEQPDGTLVIPENVFDYGEAGYLSLPPLAITGTYHVKVSDLSGAPFNVKLGLYGLPPTTQQLTAALPSKTITVGAQPILLYFNQALLTDNNIFSGVYQVVLTNNAAGEVKIEILAPDGDVIDTMISNASDFSLQPQFLNSRDVKLIRVTATGSNTGSLTVGVTEGIISTPRREPGTGKGNN